MDSIVFVSGNSGKRDSVSRYARVKNLNIDFCSMDLAELDINDIEAISKQKAKDAYLQVGRPCFVSDSGFYIEHYPGEAFYPGAFAKRSGVSSNIKGLLETMKDVEDRSCHFLDCLTFYDGHDFYIFYSLAEGTLARSIRGKNMKHAKSNLWKVFIPAGEEKTLAEMTEEEYLLYSKRKEASATVQFLDWYASNYKQEKKKVFVKNNK